MELTQHKKYALLILTLFFIWGGISYQWYVCGIKGFCGEEQVTTQATEQIATQEQITVEPAAPMIADTCEPLLTQQITVGARNDVAQVLRLQQFLNMYEGEQLTLDGKYSSADVAAVKRFQYKYRPAVLQPVGLRYPTGKVSTYTISAINTLYCDSLIKQ